MGTYLSTPVTEKNEESGDALECPLVPSSWGVVDMQGWRKSMEDSHIVQTDVAVPWPEAEADAKVFGVFDGHGGPEVARFCQLYMVSVVTQQPSWKAMRAATEKGPTAAEGDEPGNQDKENAQQPKSARDTPVGQALVDAFHALDRMIDDPERRDELIRLRAIKPDTRERLHASSIPPPPSSKAVTPSPATASDSDINKAQPQPPQQDEEEPSVEQQLLKSQGSDSENSDPVKKAGEEDKADCVDNGGEDPAAEAGAEGDDENSDGKEDDDSDAVAGKEAAARTDQDMMDDEDENIDGASSCDADLLDASGTAGKVSVMFQRLLNMGSPASGQIVVQVNEDGTPVETASGTAAAAEVVTGPSVSAPTMVRNGRMTCNLPDHAVHAGATAIVAVIVGKTITVANAGDSRAVLCRGGATYALSFDHKPLQERELNRIRNAGGFVNHFGRVNGNLNLSRSIGDLKYKQVPNIPPEEQIITADPDIAQMDMCDDDEFLILGCDGIWDCLTNEKAVEYVRLRINVMRPTEIGVQMLNDIISEDPRATQGIGGDNMTIMVVDLKPQSRSYRKSAEPPSPL